MDKRTLRVGDVVQIDPASDRRFGACFMAVTEPTAWGAQGFVQVPGSAGQAYYRCPFEGMEYVGRAAFVLPPYPEEAEMAQAEAAILPGPGDEVPIFDPSEYADSNTTEAAPEA